MTTTKSKIQDLLRKGVGITNIQRALGVTFEEVNQQIQNFSRAKQIVRSPDLQIAIERTSAKDFFNGINMNCPSGKIRPVKLHKNKKTLFEKHWPSLEKLPDASSKLRKRKSKK